MDKRTNWDIKQIFSDREKEKNNKHENHNTFQHINYAYIYVFCTKGQNNSPEKKESDLYLK